MALLDRHACNRRAMLLKAKHDAWLFYVYLHREHTIRLLLFGINMLADQVQER
ncbi:Uncharacterised protein [Plesiomonas shigelloides]|nr:Uncharacterised protein [Plesiomonas shigelloides]